MKSESTPPDRSASKLVIGLAGGIASGKSVVAGTLEELGAGIIDSDALVTEELKSPEVIETYRSWWGDRVCSPEAGIDRAALADIFFVDPEQRARMEAFLYPRLERRRRRMMRAFARDQSITAIVINSPLLYEVGLDKECDVVVFVDCQRRRRLQRAANTRGWTKQEFDRREKLQKPLDIKRKTADYIVENNSTAGALRSQVANLFDRLLSTYSQNRRSPG